MKTMSELDSIEKRRVCCASRHGSYSSKTGRDRTGTACACHLLAWSSARLRPLDLDDMLPSLDLKKKFVQCARSHFVELQQVWAYCRGYACHPGQGSNRAETRNFSRAASLRLCVCISHFTCVRITHAFHNVQSIPRQAFPLQIATEQRRNHTNEIDQTSRQSASRNSNILYSSRSGISLQ